MLRLLIRYMMLYFTMPLLDAAATPAQRHCYLRYAAIAFAYADATRHTPFSRAAAIITRIRCLFAAAVADCRIAVIADDIYAAIYAATPP